MAAPRLVKSLAVLRSQVNKLAPKRSKASDGWIGDVAHSKRKSQHNPDADGTVDALDITHDPKNGCDAGKIAEALRVSKDRRIGNVIYNMRIFSGAGKSPFVWRKYSGSNAHDKHVHIDVIDAYQDDPKPWAIDAAFGRPGAKTAPAPPKPAPSRPREPAPLASAPAKPVSAQPKLTEKQKSAVMHLGSTGDFVKELQENLNALGYGPLTEDGNFDAGTETAVKKLQAASGLKADGWAGPRTLEAVGKALKDRELQPKIEEAEKHVPKAAEKQVEQQSNWWTSVTGGLAGVGASITALTGLDWRVAVTIGVTGVVAIILLFLMRRQIIAAFKEINEQAKA